MADRVTPRQYQNKDDDWTPGNTHLVTPGGTVPGTGTTGMGNLYPRTGSTGTTGGTSAPAPTQPWGPKAPVALGNGASDIPGPLERYNGQEMESNAGIRRLYEELPVGIDLSQYSTTGNLVNKTKFQPEEETSSRGRGRVVKPKLPEEMAQQIADAYARSQRPGPDTYVNRYQPQIDAMRGQRYQDYDSRYIPMIDNLTDRLLNRGPFRYNWSDDPLYRQYAARYQQAARQGMQDTMGQAAALTGGYGSSYATAAGNQAYQNTMQGLNDAAMQLYQLAADRYDQEGADMRANLQTLETREAANRGNYDTDRATWYNRQDADLNNLLNQQAMDWQMYQDQVARDQYERELAWQMYQYWNNLAENNYSR